MLSLRAAPVAVFSMVSHLCRQFHQPPSSLLFIELQLIKIKKISINNHYQIKLLSGTFDVTTVAVAVISTTVITLCAVKWFNSGVNQVMFCQLSPVGCFVRTQCALEEF